VGRLARGLPHASVQVAPTGAVLQRTAALTPLFRVGFAVL